MITEHAALVAGGGPTGMMLAAELALAGVEVAVVDPNGAPREVPDAQSEKRKALERLSVQLEPAINARCLKQRSRMER